tara:strand:+ start:8436 stop:9362 length:927 start_codon:yes stop_codon:yes gene_type:complete
MLANFFGKSNPANFIIIFLLFLGIYFAAFFTSFSIESVNASVLFYHFSILGLFSLMFFLFNFILSKNKLTLYNSYGFLLFVLLFAFFPNTMFDREQVLLNLVLLIFLRRIYSLNSEKIVYKKIIDCGFWLGILFLLEPTSAVFGILIFISIALFQKLNARTFLITLVGFIIPVFCYFTYCFWVGKTEDFAQLFLWYSSYNFQIYLTKPVVFSLVFLGIFAIISILFKTPKVFLISGSYRKYWILIIFNFLIAISAIVIQKTHESDELLLLFFPTAIIMTNWLEGIKKPLFKNIFIVLFFLLPIIFFII